MADAAAAGVAAGIGDLAVTTGVEATVTTAACLPPVHAAAAGAADSDTGAVAAGGCVTGTGSAVGVAAVGAAVAGAAVDVVNVGATRHGHEAGSKHRAEPFCAAHPPCMERGDGEAMSVAVLSVADSGTSNCSLRCRMKFAAAGGVAGGGAADVGDVGDAVSDAVGEAEDEATGDAAGVAAGEAVGDTVAQ